MNDSPIESQYLPAARAALKAFPIQAEDLRLVCHSENVTFRVVSAGDESRYSLRLHRPGYNSLAELNCERKWTAALRQAGIAVPQSLRTSSGEYFHPVGITATGERRLAGMTTWLEGKPLDAYLPGCNDAEERQRIFRQTGVILARIHNQTAGWREPPGFQRRTLDSEGLVGENPHWGRFWEHAGLTPSEQELLNRSRLVVREALDEYGMDPSTFSLIHADAGPDNIVYDGDRLALIDFDDAAYGWHLYDIATALFIHRNLPDFATLRASLLDGYRSHRVLEEKDLAALPLFMLVRGLALIGWVHQRPEHDRSDYFRRIRDWVCAECGKLR